MYCRKWMHSYLCAISPSKAEVNFNFLLPLIVQDRQCKQGKWNSEKRMRNTRHVANWMYCYHFSRWKRQWVIHRWTKKQLPFCFESSTCHPSTDHSQVGEVCTWLWLHGSSDSAESEDSHSSNSLFSVRWLCLAKHEDLTNTFFCKC